MFKDDILEKDPKGFIAFDDTLDDISGNGYDILLTSDNLEYIDGLDGSLCLSCNGEQWLLWDSISNKIQKKLENNNELSILIICEPSPSSWTDNWVRNVFHIQPKVDGKADKFNEFAFAIDGRQGTWRLKYVADGVEVKTEPIGMDIGFQTILLTMSLTTIEFWLNGNLMLSEDRNAWIGQNCKLTYIADKSKKNKSAFKGKIQAVAIFNEVIEY